jgi:EF-P beta-lysylation protein EpmB
MSQPVTILPTAITGSSAKSPWKRELADAETSVANLLERLNLGAHRDLITPSPDFKCLVTDSYIAKMRPGDINDPLLRQVLPLQQEEQTVLQTRGILDPVGDLDAQTAPGILHKYKGRALLITTGACAIHCRYCFRRHYPYQQASFSNKRLHDTLEYISAHDEIDEIILSGGDPLVLDNERLGRLVFALESVEHIRTLRIHTRLPVVLPSRIDTGLLDLLKHSRFQIVMVIHANHANELQHEEQERLFALHQAGVTLLNQSVLLRGVNDDASTLVALSKRLFQCNTLPYYLHSLDPVTGAMHFEVDKAAALSIKEEMDVLLPGYLAPRLVEEIAGKQSKSAIFRI